ncbi:MAG: DUF58 domain-containing protein [Chloroflexi bacterium]|nr:DUF58 domain-containing protein [Chloroflexota bacterium]
MRLAGLVALWVATLIIALTGGWSVMYRVSYVVFLLIAVSWLWALVGIRTMSVDRRARTQRAQVGSQFEESVAIENTSRLPKPWLEVRSHSALAGHSVAEGMFLGPKAHRSWTQRTECAIRGKFAVGDLVCTTGDPFGLFQRSRRYPSEATVVVYPRTVQFVTAMRMPGLLPGGAQQSGHVPFVTPMASGVREYQPSDPYHRIHWASTARMGRVMVKEFELDPFSDVWIVLDLNVAPHRGTAPESTDEYAVTIAASLLQHFLMQGRAVGLIGQHQLLPPDRGTRQLSKGLEILALVQAIYRETLVDILAAESVRFNRNAVTWVVTPSSEPGWVGLCEELRHRGVHIMAVPIDAASFAVDQAAGSSTAQLEVISRLNANGIPVHSVKQGDKLEGLLAPTQPLAASNGAMNAWQH